MIYKNQWKEIFLGNYLYSPINKDFDINEKSLYGMSGGPCLLMYNN